ncbi:MAG: SoxR reducing system RseC family protein [Gammaproteobacteria bacterium]|jgi:sigma-E factor negative regulatory protein RseC|nr:SoxR reducing system RseC family protein [Gammaproteobacteria bacterium]
MIEEIAQVIDIKGNNMILQAQRQSACGSCAANKGCGTSVLSKVVGRKFTRFQADNSINASVGDTVVVAIPEDAMLKGSLVMYLVPILGMIVISLLADYVLDPALQYRDFVIAVTAFVGLVFGALVARRYFASRSSAHLFTPVVLRKIIT